MIEAAGIATITLSYIPAWTASVSAPRVAGIDHPPGRPFGEPGDKQLQTAVLWATLDALRSMDTPGQVIDLPHVWHQAAKDVRWHSKTPPPITKLCIKRPWNYARLVAGQIPPRA